MTDATWWRQKPAKKILDRKMMKELKKLFDECAPKKILCVRHVKRKGKCI